MKRPRLISVDSDLTHRRAVHRSSLLCVQALAALKKYRATVQRRGRDAIDNRCGYLIGFLKQYQDGVAVIGVPGNSGQPSRSSHAVLSNGDGTPPSNSTTNQSSSASNGHNAMANGARSGAANGAGGPPPAATVAASLQPTANGGGGGLGGGSNGSGVRPISYLQLPVRKQLEKLFESGKDKAVLEDVGLIKQLARLSEEQALAALKNYKEASKHRRDIHNKSAYLMGILRGYIEGTTPISKAPWEGRGGDDGAETSTSTAPVPPPPSGPGGSRARGRGRGSGQAADEVERSGANSMPQAQAVPPPSQPPQPPHHPQQQQQSPPSQPSAPPSAPSVQVSAPRELGGFASAPVQPQQPAPSHGTLSVPLAVMSSTPSTSPVSTSPLGGGGLFLGGIGHNGVGVDSAQRYDPSSSLLYLDGSVGGGVSGFGAQVHPSSHQQPPRHASPHESLFGHHSSADHNGGQQQPLVGPGLLGGEFLSNGGGSDRGLVLGGGYTPPAAAAHSSGLGSHSNHGLFGSGLLAGGEFGSSSNGSLGNNAPTSPGSGSAQGSTSGLGSGSLSVAGSGVESPLGSEAGNDVITAPPAANAVSTGSFSGAASSSCNDSVDCPSSSSPRSRESRENTNTSNANGVVGGMIDMLARLNLSKYVPVLAEAEVDMDALRLFGEVCGFSLISV